MYSLVYCIVLSVRYSSFYSFTIYLYILLLLLYTIYFTLPPSLLLEGSLPAPVYTVNTNLFQGKQYGVAVYTQSVGKVQGIVRHIGYCGIFSFSEYS